MYISTPRHVGSISYLDVSTSNSSSCEYCCAATPPTYALLSALPFALDSQKLFTCTCKRRQQASKAKRRVAARPKSTLSPLPAPFLTPQNNRRAPPAAAPTPPQIVDMAGKLPDYVVACVGGGSNAIGMFHPFVGDVDAGDVKLVGVEAGGKGMDALNSATLTQGSPGVLHGTRTYLLQVRRSLARSLARTFELFFELIFCCCCCCVSCFVLPIYFVFECFLACLYCGYLCLPKPVRSSRNKAVLQQ